MNWKRGLGVAGVLVALAGLAGFLAQDRILTWYYVQQLSEADTDRDTWAKRVAGLGGAAVDKVLACLGGQDKRASENAACCFEIMLEQAGPDNPLRQSVFSQLTSSFKLFSVHGQIHALELARDAHADDETIEALLAQAATTDDEAIKVLALDLALKSKSDLNRASAQQLACACLKGAEPATRKQAIELAFRAGVPEQTVALLRDADVEVRRAAMLRLGPATDIIGTDDLLYWLHDGDLEVRKLCEGALRGRGLHAEHLKMGRLITDPHSTNRLRILDHLMLTAEVEPGIWLRRLSHDPSPAVRAASIRVASEHVQVDLSDRIEQMAVNDPSPTIRQLARFYLDSQLQR